MTRLALILLLLISFTGIRAQTTPQIIPQDCETALLLCSKGGFTQSSFSGAGVKNNETAGACLGQELNSLWYKWTANESGTFTFLITPNAVTTDINWILYDLGAGGGCAQIIPANAIRCAAGSGINCTPSYYITGLDLKETDLREESGCPTGNSQNGLVRFIDMVAGHNYALIIENSSGGNNGFRMQFGGSATFLAPIAKFSMVNNNPCSPLQSFTFTNQSADYQLLKWTFGNGSNISTSSSEGPIVVSYNTPGEKIVTLEATSSNGCTEVFTSRFSVFMKPALPTPTYVTTKLCSGNIVNFSANPVDGAIYHWSGPNGFTSREQNPPAISVTGNENSGEYEFFVEVGYCRSDVVKINILPSDPKTEALFDIIVNSKCLANQSLTLVNQSTNYATFDWDFGSGVNSTNILPNGNSTVFYGTSGLKELTLTVVGENGCVSRITKQIDVQLAPEIPIISTNQSAFCLGDVINLSVNETTGLAYFWTGPNNFTANTASITINVTSSDLSGTYRVYTQAGDCTSEIASFVVPSISKIPEASFTTIPTNLNLKLSAPARIGFKNNSKDANRYYWDFGDGNTSTEINPVHTYTSSGTYNVKLTAIADGGCSNNVSYGDLIISNASFFVPNAFTPNDDGINDEFVVSIVNLQQYKISIYNRLGNLVFTSNNIFENWKGKYRNENVPVGIYYYVISGRNLDNQDMKYSGSLTLFR